jgi:S1-C subfamily serine protease
MTLTDLNGELSRRLGAPSDLTGAVIRELEPRGAAAQAGMRQGDIIVEVNRVAVDSASRAVQELQLVDSGEPAFFLIWRDGSETFVQATKE